MDDADAGGWAFGRHQEVDGQSDRVGADALAQGGQGVTVPGQPAVVVAGQDDERAIGRGGEGSQGLGETRVGVEDAADVRWAGKQLEAVAGDDEDARSHPLVEDLAELGLDGAARLGGEGRQVQVADDDGARALGHGHLGQVGDRRSRLRRRAGTVARLLRCRHGGRRGDRCRLVGHSMASGRRMGNRITSRMEVTSASSITRRSSPMPMPEVGGRPYSSAADERPVRRVRLLVARRRCCCLGDEPRLLLLGHVQLAVAVGQLLGVDHELEAVGQSGVVGPVASQRADLDREAGDELRVEHAALEDFVVHLEDELARAPRLHEGHVVRGAHGAHVLHRVARMHPSAHRLLQQVEQLVAGPGRREVHLAITHREGESTRRGARRPSRWPAPSGRCRRGRRRRRGRPRGR